MEHNLVDFAKFIKVESPPDVENIIPVGIFGVVTFLASEVDRYRTGPAAAPVTDGRKSKIIVVAELLHPAGHIRMPDTFYAAGHIQIGYRTTVRSRISIPVWDAQSIRCNAWSL